MCITLWVWFIKKKKNNNNNKTNFEDLLKFFYFEKIWFDNMKACEQQTLRELSKRQGYS